MATKTLVGQVGPISVEVYAAPYAAEGPLIAGTSLTPNSIDIVTNKTFAIVEYNRSFFTGARLRATAVGFTDTWLEGIVTAWDGQNVTIDGDLAHNASSTVYSNWAINVSGQPGLQGPPGATGPEGPSGGPAGPAGPPGAPGSVWRNGNGAPANSLGANGDYYLNDLTGDVYLRTSSIYSIVANIEGAPGATGAAGPTGPTGPQGIIAEAPTDGGYYARRNAAWAAPPGGGNVSAVGTPTPGQFAQWTSSNTISGIDPSAGSWVLKSGGTMTGLLELSYSSPTFNLRKGASGQASQILGYTGTGASSPRWGMLLGDATAESGSNAGSNFSLQAYDDTGAALSPPALSITRSTRLATVAADPTAALGIATKQYVDAGLRPNVTATITIGYTFTPYNAGTVTTGTFTPAPANGNYQYYTNGGAHTLAAPAADCAIDIMITNAASGAGAVTFSGFTVGASVGDPLTTTANAKFIISIRRINGISTYSQVALQ